MILDLSKEPHSRGMMGSPGFVAPEVILGQHHTSQMDCYSLGVLLFVMLVGVKPMTQDQARSMQYALMTPESLRGMHVRAPPSFLRCLIRTFASACLLVSLLIMYGVRSSDRRNISAVSVLFDAAMKKSRPSRQSVRAHRRVPPR